MNIGIIAKSREIMNTAGIEVYDIIKSCGGQVLFFEENFFLKEAKKYSREDFFNLCDKIVVLGGDGTLLKIASYASEKNVPVLGINYGRIGLLTDMEREELKCVEEIFKDSYKVDERMMLKAQIVSDGNVIKEFLALNDIVISRGTTPKMLEMNLYIDEDLSSNIRADGIICATPTGSTAYSLSAGGSVIDPKANLIAFTPICPHTLNSRPLIIDSTRKLKLSHLEKDGISYLSCDGKDIYTLERKCDVKISASEHKLKLIRIKNRNFYSILREKL